MSEKRPFTFSMFVRVPRAQPRRWWHRLLGVDPRPVMGWERRHFTTDFNSAEEAVLCCSVLQRPEVIAGLLMPGQVVGPSVHEAGDRNAFGAQLEEAGWERSSVNYIPTSEPRA
jgi:hypothetical protein